MQVNPQEREITLISNCFRFLSTPANTIYGYLIEYSPEIDATNQDLRRYLIRKARSQIQIELNDFYYYDYLISATYKPSPFSVKVQGRSQSFYILNIRFISTIMPDSFQFLWYLNILIKIQQRSLGLKQLTSKPSFFNPSESIDLKHLGLSIWNGYRATVNTVANDLLITMDVASKIFNQKNVLDAFEEINEPNLEARKRRINDLVAGQIVMTIYNKRFYRVLNVDFEANPDSEFETKDGKMSFREYLMQQYNVRIKAPRQPMLVAAQRGFEMKIVPELCFLTGVPDRVRNNPSIMRSIREFNRSDPDERFKSIMAHMEKMTNQCKALEQGQLLKISPQPIQVRAFELPAITINLKFESLECTERGFSIKNTIKNPVPIPILRIFHNQNDYKNAEFLNISLQSRLKILGIPIDRLDFTLFDSPPTLFDELNILRHNPSPPKICIVILPRRDKLYNEVKSISLKIEIPVQCVVSSQFRNDRKIESILNNLTLQIAAKTGSQLWTIPRSPGIPQITMIVGMDVYHDTVNRKQSVLGFAASLNPDFTKYYSTIRKQAKIGEEVSASVEECFHEALLAFFEETRQRFLPNCIVVFRDGVGDSQEDIVKNVEIRGLFKVFRRFQNYEPEVVYVVICKRIDTRFLIQSHGSYFNPRAGTCIFDEEVCDDDTFYLITTNVFQGTATPVKYKIVENHSNISKRTLSQFAFSLCHLYYNWKGSIKLPVCTQLAHKLAYVVGENVHIDASEKLRKTYWYL